jgi:hypothetical protein
MMEATRLKSRRGWAAFAPELPFPKSNPLLNRDFIVLRRAEKMDMIGHDHVRADQPCISLSPSLHESIMVGLLCECCRSMQCANSQKEDRWAIP